MSLKFSSAWSSSQTPARRSVSPGGEPHPTLLEESPSASGWQESEVLPLLGSVGRYACGIHTVSR